MDSKVEIEHIMPVIGIKHNVLKQCAGIHHTDDFKRISETIGNKILSAEGIHKSIGKEYFSLKKIPRTLKQNRPYRQFLSYGRDSG